MSVASPQSSSPPTPSFPSPEPSGGGKNLLSSSAASGPPGNEPGNLVLTLAMDDSFFIGPAIAITVVGIKGDRVRLAIQAPRELNIIRLTPSKTGEFQCAS